MQLAQEIPGLVWNCGGLVWSCGLLRHCAGRGKNREPEQTESSDFHSGPPDLSHLLVAAAAATTSASVETEMVIKMVIPAIIRSSNPLPKPQAKAVIVSPSMISVLKKPCASRHRPE